MRLLSRTLIVLCIIDFPLSLHAQNSNVFRVSVDRVAMNGGDSVDVSVRYTLTATKPHDIHSITARLMYDSSLIHVVSLETKGTATNGFYILDTITPTVIGLLAAGSGDQEIDLTNPVLFRLRVWVNPRLSDTAWIGWERSVTMFGDTSYGIDSVIMDDGWVTTANSFARTTISIPPVRALGRSDGFSPDSVRFSIPIVLSDIGKANVRSGKLNATFETNRLSFVGASSGNQNDAMIANVSSTASTLSVDVASVGQSIAGNDTIIVLHFAALVGTDTVSTALSKVSWRPTNTDALIGNVYYQIDSIRFFGSRLSSVSVTPTESEQLRMYPNPVRDHLHIEIISGSESDQCAFAVYDLQGKLIARSMQLSGGLDIPSGTPKGFYEVEVGPLKDGSRWVRTLCVGP